MARGVFSSYDELYTGMVGMHGTKTSNLGISECDLLIVIGARFSDRIIGNSSKFAVKSNIVHIDIDSSEIGKNVAVYKGIVGDAKAVLKKLNSKLAPKRHDEWIAHINSLKEKHPLKYDADKLNVAMTDIKSAVADKGDKLTEDQAKTIVQQTINNYNLNLSDTQINLLVNFAMNLSKSSIIDSASFKSTLSSLKDSIVSKAGNTFSGINLNFNANKAVENSKNIFAQIWQAIVDFFTGLSK